MTSPALIAARARTTYGLTFAHAPRDLKPHGLDGPDLPNSYDPGGPPQLSKWDGEGPGDDATENEWIQFWASCAVQEAVHEALEWFKIDGRAWLDPHGYQEAVIFELSSQLAEHLAKLAETRPPIA